MNRLLVVCLVLMLFICGQLDAAEQPQSSPFHLQLVPPEMILQHREAIGLTDEQLQRCQRHLQEGNADAQQAQRIVKPATDKLAELLAAEKIDESATMQQLDKVMAAEREVKRVHLRVMIRLRNELTVEQRRMLAKKIQQPQMEVQNRLQQKLTRIQQEIQRRAKAGQPPENAIRLMQSFQQRMQAGRPDEAETLLDRVLRILELDDGQKPVPDGGNQNRNGDAATDSGAQPASMSRVPVLKPQPLHAVRQQFKNLQDQEVAWRGISWDACLVDGLKQSRDQNKPVILWIFIDRPVDDARC